jgi:hypothetical protein
MWGLWGLNIVNLLSTYFDGLLPKQNLVGILFINGILAFIIHSASRGKRWARYAYCAAAALFLVTIVNLVRHGLLSPGQQFLTLAQGLAYLAVLWLLFRPSSARWFRKVEEVRQLFRPSRIVRALVYNFLGITSFISTRVLHDKLPWELPMFYGVDLHVLSAWIGVTYLPLSGVGFIFARWLHRRQQDQIQSKRNSRANEIAELLLARSHEMDPEPVPPYVLYLRPFATYLRFPVAKENRKFLDGFLYGRWFDFESWLGKVSREGSPSWNVYAIGGPGRGVGADKLSTCDEGWKQLFELLAMQAYAIVVCPFDRPGTRWEIDEIISSPELVSKAIFVLPPPRRLSRRHLAASWERTRQRLRDAFPAFPGYHSECVVFALRPTAFAVLELQRGQISLRRFKSIVLGTQASAEIEQLWKHAPNEIKAELPRLFRKMGLDTGTHRPGLVVTQPVRVTDDVFDTQEAQVALNWLVDACLVSLDRGSSASDPSALVRLHPAALTWSRAQAWLAGDQ